MNEYQVVGFYGPRCRMSCCCSVVVVVVVIVIVIVINIIITIIKYYYYYYYGIEVADGRSLHTGIVLMDGNCLD